MHFRVKKRSDLALQNVGRDYMILPRVYTKKDRARWIRATCVHIAFQFPSSESHPTRNRSFPYRGRLRDGAPAQSTLGLVSSATRRSTAIGRANSGLGKRLSPPSSLYRPMGEGTYKSISLSLCLL